MLNPETTTAALPTCPDAVREARKLLARAAPEDARWSLDDALLCLSELVSNAVEHGVGPLGLRVQASAERLRVEVLDGAPRALPERLSSDGAGYDTTPPPLATAGRGLYIVERLADRWDVERGPDTKTVWFELAAPR